LWAAVALLAGLLAAFSPGAAPSPAAPADSPPVLLRQSPLLTPAEAAGSGVAPEIKVRVTVDFRGRVAKVEVLAIDPSSAYDDVFRRAVEQQLRWWRYAPARSDGEPVEVKLEWTVKFLAREGTGGVDLDAAPSAPGGGEDARRARISMLPPERRAELLRGLAESSEKHLDRRHRQRADSPRFVVISDAPDETTAATLAGNLEATYNLLDSLFRPEVAPQPEPYKTVAYVFWKESSLDAVQAAIGVPPWPAGFYQTPGLLVFHLEVGTPDSLLHTMLHEAFHAYADRHLCRPGFYLPTWFNEGFAEYLGNSEIKRGQLIPGRLLKGKYVLRHSSGAYRMKTDASWSLDDVKRAMRSGKALSVAQLVRADPTVFYGENRSLYYPMSWLLVHFLRHGRPEWAQTQFPALALYLAEGYPGEDAIETAYGLSLADLDAPFLAYAKGL
jgi:Gram-negative bacterial TonB protein C-terminal